MTVGTSSSPPSPHARCEVSATEDVRIVASSWTHTRCTAPTVNMEAIETRSDSNGAAAGRPRQDVPSEAVAAAPLARPREEEARACVTVDDDNCTVADAHALLDSIPMVCGRMATASPAPQPQARGAGSTTEPANSHSGTWALRHERPLRRWRDMTDGSEIDEDAVVRSVAAGPTAAARAEAQRHQDAGRLAAATGADWVPPSVEAWTACLADKEEFFRELLPKPTTLRRSRSYRLDAAPDMPEPALRIQPHPHVRAPSPGGGGVVAVRVRWGVGCSATLVAGEAAMASEAGAACPAAAAAGAGYADVGAGDDAAPRGPSLPSGRQEIRAEPQATGMESRWRGSSSWSHPGEDNNVYNRAKEEAWAQYQREYDAAKAVSGSVAAAAASGAAL